MKKFWKRIGICACVCGLFWIYGLMTDKAQLRQELIRFHVVANSDSGEDQAVKLKVRDAVLESIREDLASVGDVEQAKAYLQENLGKIAAIANQTLEKAGVSQQVQVSLCPEAFGTRQYDTFSLPSGIYESLRIIIGEGLGQNWWCVSFPSLCLPATTDGFREQAVSSGFSPAMTNTLTRKGPYRIRFFLLDALGKWEIRQNNP